MKKLFASGYKKQVLNNQTSLTNTNSDKSFVVLNLIQNLKIFWSIFKIQHDKIKPNSSSPFTQAKLAFTLVEILITLGIIGVVAAMTIPNLIQNSIEKRTVSQLREVQSILSQAVRSAEEEYGDVTGWGLTGNNKQSALIIAERLKPYLKLAQDCGTNDNKFNCFPNVKYDLLSKNGKVNTIYATNEKYYKVKLLNGISLFWRAGTPDEMQKDEYIKIFHRYKWCITSK